MKFSVKILILIIGICYFMVGDIFAFPISGISKDPFIEVKTSNATIEDQLLMLASQIFSLIKIVVGGLALIFIVIIGVKMIVFSDSEDRIKTQKKQITYALLGFLFLNIPGLLYDFFQPGKAGGSIDPPNFSDVSSCLGFWNMDIICNSGGTFGNLVSFLRVFIFGIAILAFTWASYSLIVSGGDDERRKKAKNKFLYGSLALVFLWFIEIWSRLIARGDFGTWGEVATVGKKLISLAFFFAGPVAVFFIIYGAYYYITSSGDEERVKKGKSIIINTCIATVILIACYTFLNDLVRFVP